MSYTKKLMRGRDKESLVYRVRGIDTTRRMAWYYVKVSRHKLSRFLRHKPGDSYDLTDYGDILASGYMEHGIPEEVREELASRFGIDNFD